MLMLRALKHPALFRLWVGQVFSTIGDEIYRVGLTWLAVGLIGENTVYLSASQAAALMIMSFVGGKWADNWEPIATMVRIDQVRAVLVLVPVAVSFFTPVPLWLLIGMAITLSGLGAFFDPALQTALPTVAPDTTVLRAAMGLMGTTIRLARMVGPAVVGILFGVIPPIHFFTMDAVTFILSAVAVAPLRPRAGLGARMGDEHAIAEGAPGRSPEDSANVAADGATSVEGEGLGRGLSRRLREVARRRATRRVKRVSFVEAVRAGFRAVNADPPMRNVTFAKAITGSTWNLAYGLGFALLVQGVAPGNAGAFGLVMAGYGLGNFLGALYYGNLLRPRPARLMSFGFVCLGLGFCAMSWVHSLTFLSIASALTGFTGTANEVTYFDLVQARFPLTEMSRIFRLRMALETAFTLVLMLLAPLLFKFAGVRPVIAACGVIWIVSGIIGLRHARDLD